MQFIKTADAEEGEAALLSRLEGDLQAGRQVLWLVPGGSNIPLSVSVMEGLERQLTTNLTIMLTDERYGPVGHADSNANQLLDAGFVPKKATIVPVLMPDLPLEATVRHYAAEAKRALQAAESVVAQFGIGEDGHIAGILPGSPAVSSPELAAGYEAPPFVRLTLTFHAFKRITAAYAFVYGAKKLPALERLRDETLPYAEQPSQILKELPEAYIYNDQLTDA